MQPIIKKNTTASSKKQITLQGTPACPGIATGPAHIVCGVADLTDFDQIKPGKILVFRNMNTAWVPYHPLIAGIISDIGGSLSAGCTMAREFGIPVVVGLGNATTRICNGQTVTVDGIRGSVILFSVYPSP